MEIEFKDEKNVKNEKISLIVPSRGRLELLICFLNSVFDKVSNIENIEVILVVDNDDFSGFGETPLPGRLAGKASKSYPSLTRGDPNISYANKIKEFLKLKQWDNHVVVIEEQPRDKGYSWAYNLGAQNASGRALWALADDVEILVTDYDKIILENLTRAEQSCEDNAFLIKIGDGTHLDQSDVCAFHILSREAYKRMGKLVPGELYTWGNDFLIYKIFSENNMIHDLSKELFVAHYSRFNQDPKYRICPDETVHKSWKLAHDQRHGSHMAESNYIFEKYSKKLKKV